MTPQQTSNLSASLRTRQRHAAHFVASQRSSCGRLNMGGIVGVYQRHEFVNEMREAISRYEAWLSSFLELAPNFPQ
jgi:hypothetical protein